MKDGFARNCCDGLPAIQGKTRRDDLKLRGHIDQITDSLPSKKARRVGNVTLGSLVGAWCRGSKPERTHQVRFAK